MLEWNTYIGAFILAHYEEVFGWTGFVLGLGAYWVLSYPHKYWQYVVAQVANLVAAEMFIISAMKYGFMQSISFNIVWGIIAVISLITHRKGV